MTVYFTSDLHLGHENIIKFTDRPFGCLEEMHQTLIRNINDKVKADDELYILGDFSFKLKRSRALGIRSRIECKNLHLIRGNHDCGWSGTNAFRSVSDYLELKTTDSIFILCHYPFASWNGMRRGSIHLHGHIHSNGAHNRENLEKGRRIFDVGVDANEYKPVSIEDISEWFSAIKKP